MKRFGFQLLVIWLLFSTGGCGLLRDLNPCDCALSQENNGVPFALGQTGSGIVSMAQRISVQENVDISKIALVVGNYGGQSNQLRVTIYGDNGSGTAPNTGSVIATSLNKTITNINLDWVNFCFAVDCTSGSVTLTQDVYYWIVVTRPTSNALSGTSYYWVGADLEGAPQNRLKVLNSGNLITWSGTDEQGYSLSSYSLSFRLGCESNDQSCQ